LLQNVLSRILTVSELTSQIRNTLEDQFPVVWVEGQISNLRRPSSGHQYFTLKDQSSQIRVVLFRGVAQHLSFALEEGLEVIIRGGVTAYELRGDYQLILQSVEPKGIGSLQLAFEQLKAKLQEEGLFDRHRKQAIPSFPSKIGIITSRHGAALYDILNIVHRRSPMMSIIIHPVLVQGVGAAQQIAHAIHTMNTQVEVDVLIVGRGGGSLEDLWSFNEEVVVRAIAESKTPVISAVGHETDVTLADMAADLRAPTPSAAAEMVAPSAEDLLLQVMQLSNRLTRCIQNRLSQDRHKVKSARSDLPDPVLSLYRYGQRVDDMEARLGYMVRNFHARLREELTYLVSQISANTPQHRTHAGQRLIPQLWIRAIQGMQSIVKEKRHQSFVKIAMLQTLSPLTVLSRGYSIVEDVSRKKIVKSIRDVTVGDYVRAKFVDGTIKCLVEEIKEEC